MNSIIKIAAVTVFAAFISVSFAQEKIDNEQKQMECCQKNDGKMEHGKMECCKTDDGKMEHGKMEHGKMEHGKMEHGKMECCEKKEGKMSESKDHKMMMHKEQDSGNPVVRKGIVDLKAIDKNKDGKVYQDMMDWNVISDEPGECPLCGMTLKEVTLKNAEENLINNNFKVKK